MPAFLVYGGNQENREQRALEICKKYDIEDIGENVDIYILEPEEDKKSIGIEQVRNATKFLQEKPIKYKNKIILLKRAYLLTIQAQNAFLKTLEEPPEYSLIFLLTKTENSLLETVKSRCKRVFVGDGKKEIDIEYKILDICRLNYGEKMSVAADISGLEKEEIIEILENWVKTLRENLNRNNATNIESILKVKESLEKTNVATKLALEHLLLSIRADSN